VHMIVDEARNNSVTFKIKLICLASSDFEDFGIAANGNNTSVRNRDCFGYSKPGIYSEKFSIIKNSIGGVCGRNETVNGNA